MRKIGMTCLAGVFLLSMSTECAARQWSLKDCIDYAIANNIQLQKAKLQQYSALEDVKQSQSALLPSLSLSTSQNVSYNPWPEKGSAMIAGNKVQAKVDKVYYNGSYSLMGNWTVWNGNRNTNQVKLNQLSVEQNECDSITTARNIEEQIAQLYVQIAYVKENVGVQKATLEAAIVNENRGKEMLEVGKMSKADLMQLTAQRAQDEYNVVQAESEVRNYKRQLKQLLQITDTEEFDIAGFEASDEMALADIPALQSVYDNALRNRPEFKSLALQVESSELSKKIAKAQGLPTIGLTASAGTNTTSLGDQSWGIQAKQNFSLGGGLSISVPIIDQRQKRTAVNKAEISRQQALLDIKDKQVELYSTIENYWIQA